MAKNKRTKTFTGCATCRSRGVKCDEERPICRRCKDAFLNCKGYGARLTWPGCKEPKGSQRMSLLNEFFQPVQSMTQNDVSFAIERLDLVSQECSCVAGPFGVFPVCTDASASAHRMPEVDKYIETERSRRDETKSCAKALTRTFRHQKPLQHYGLQQTEEEIDRIVSTSEDTNRRLEASLFASFPAKHKEDRQLMHFWLTVLSPLMLPTPSADNPFLTIIMPLAMSAAYSPEDAASNSLLHAIYALAAASRANLQRVEQSGRVVGARHLRLSMQYLMRSISGNREEKSPETVLAAINILVIAGIINGESSDWRVHLRGAFAWIQCVEKRVWRRSRDSSMIYQMFLCVEALRPAHKSLALELEPLSLLIEDSNKPQDEISRPQDDLSSASEMEVCQNLDYCLDKIFCISQPILEAIIQINKWVYIDQQPPTSALDALELKIIRSNPELMRSARPASVSEPEQMRWRYACLWYSATYLYFSRALQRLPVDNVQHLVRQGVEHLDAITLLEVRQNVSGILWPAFIAGCEANDADSRRRIEGYFDKRETLGIGNTADARTVVREVWRRRDKSDRSVDISWHEVMVDLGINIATS